MKGFGYVYRVLGRVASAGLLGGALLVGAGASPALAQYGRVYDDGQRYADTSTRSVVQNGYREGFEHGQADRNRGRGFSATDDSIYNRGGRAYSAELRSLFRRAYEQGYSDGYHRRGYDSRIADRFDYRDYRDDRYGNGRIGRNDVVRIAQVNGYSEGFENGILDRADRRGVSYSSRNEYRQATTGYRREFGDLREYQSNFRQAYARGYQDAYNGRSFNRSFDRGVIYRDYGRYGYDPYYGAPSYRSTPVRVDTRWMAQQAAQQGFEDGYMRGQYDRQIGTRRPNPQGHGAYQHALNGWNPEWGGAGTFQQYYRTYFTQGYEQGFYGRARSGYVFRQF